MQSVMSGAITVINEIINAVGGLKKFAAIVAGIAAGAGGGALAGSVAGGVGAVPGAIIGGITGGLYANSKVDGGGPGIDAEAIKKKMNDAFKSILESIGNTGMNTAEGSVAKFMKSFNDAFAGASSEGFDTATALDKIESNFRTFTDGLHLGMLGETIGYGAFLKQLSGGTASAIAMFQRQLAFGNISVEEMGASLEKVKDEAFAALDMQLERGTITNEEYANSIIGIQAQFDSLDISGLNAFMGGDQMPAWIRELSNIESPLEIYRRKMEELQMTLADRPDLFAAGAAQLTAELERSVGAMEELKNPGALMQGSSAAFSQVLKITGQISK
jgi:hypothetical protein